MPMVNPKRIRYRYCQACPLTNARELVEAISWKDSPGERKQPWPRGKRR